eukprot:jgi/Ulvmu1/5432/UM022_0227.1
MTEGAAFTRLVKSRFTPVIAVQASAEVQATCGKNGLTFVDLLRACSEGAGVGSQGFPFRVEKGTVRVEGAFNIRFYDAGTLRPTPVPRANEHLHHTWMPKLMRRHGDLMEQLASSSILEGIAGHTESSKVTPWFTEYSQEFIRTTLFQSHETIDHPLGIIYALNAHAADCAAVAVELLRPHVQPSADEPCVPPAMATAAVLPFWDPDFPRHFVLVVDVLNGVLTSEQIKSQAEALFKAVNLLVPGGSAPRISLLTLNSGTGDSDEAGAAVDWVKHIHSTLPSKADNTNSVVPSAGEPLERPALDAEGGSGRGCWLSSRNLDDTRAFISTVIRDTLCNPMEQRMSAIRGTVQQHRGGIFKSFTKAVGLSSRISRATKSGPAARAEPSFGYDSSEGQLRLLGDMYFMIGQYQDAEGCYADVASEFKSAKAIRHWAAALEALALSRFMQMAAQGSMAMELWRPMDDAFRAYASLQQATSSRAQGSAVLTARCGLFFGGLMAAVGQMDDAFACYTRASNFAEPVLGAMLLEQAALCQARMAPARLRKAIQYLTLAGVRYHHQRLAGLAVVSFRGVSTHLHERWPAVSITVAEAGAMACQERARWRDSALYLCAALSTPAGQDPGGDAETTRLLLLQLRRVLCNARDVATHLFRDPQVLALGVPQVDDSTVPMQLRGVQVCMHGEKPGDNEVADRHWKVMEEAATQSPAHKVLLSRPKSKHQYTVMFADEPLQVHVTVTNPLPVDVRVKNFRLACSCVLTEAGAAGADGMGIFPSSVLVPADLQDLCHRSDESTASLVVEPQAFTLGPRRTETRVLLVRPMRAAWLYIGGVRWEIEPAADVAASPRVGEDAIHEFDPSDPHVEAACMFKPSVKRLRYGSAEESRYAGQHMRGMMIGAATRGADAAQPPRLHFTERTCLALKVLPPGPLVMLRPAESVGNLAVEPVPREIPTKVFASWPSQKRPVMMPASLLQGELVPLAFVLSRAPGCRLRNVLLLTTNPDISLHPEIDAGSVSTLTAQDVLTETERFWKPAAPGAGPVRRVPSYYDSDLPLQRFPIDTESMEWVGAKDSMEHASLTLWMHPRRSGEQHLRIALAYEDEHGAFRMTRFADSVHVRPAVVHRPGRMQPVVGSLDLWTLSVKIHASQTILGLASVFSLHLKEAMMQSQEWQCASVVANDAEKPLGETCMSEDEIASTPLDAMVQPGGIVLSMRLRRKPASPETAGQPSAGTLRLMVLWELRSSHACPHVGLFRCQGLRPLELVRDCAVRMRLEAEGIAGDSGPLLLQGDDEASGHRDVPVVLRLLNGGAHTVSVCVECGDVSLQEGETGGPGQVRATNRSTHALAQATRHMWLGPVRRYVKRLEPLGEVELPACVRVLGYGPAIVQDYVCSWQAVEVADLQGVVVGEPLQVVVLPCEHLSRGKASVESISVDFPDT